MYNVGKTPLQSMLTLFESKFNNWPVKVLNYHEQIFSENALRFEI